MSNSLQSYRLVCQALCPWASAGKNTRVEEPCPPPGDPPDPGIEPMSLTPFALEVSSLPLVPPSQSVITSRSTGQRVEVRKAVK